MKPNKKKHCLKFACLLLAGNVSVQADVLTDGTVGDVFYLFGDNMIIPQSYGTTVGNNLFHSFAMFNIYNGEAVTFTGSNTLENVIARVTGGDVSTINGILSSNIGKANFYFINPAGVTFGKDVVVDVPAAFHVSTANQINFADGSVYSASNPGISTLTIAPPESFGFVGQTGDIVLDGAQIVAKENQTIDLVANNITLKNGADLYVPSGEVRLVAAKGSQAVSLVRDENGFLPMPTQTPNGENAGNILLDNSVIDTTGNGGGRVSLWGGDITLKADNYKASAIFADNDGGLNIATGKGVNIQSYLLSLNNSVITSDALASGNAGSVIVNSENIDIINRGNIRSSTWSQGNAGNVSISAGQLKIDGQLSGYATGIYSQADSDSKYGSGNAGNITIKAEKLDILNEGQIDASTFSLGNGGNVNVSANQLRIENSQGHVSGISSQTNPGNSGNAGNVTVKAGNLYILNGGSISSSTFSTGNAGNVNVTANQLVIDGQGNSIPTGIFSQGDIGNAGSITVNTGNLNILNGGGIDSSAFLKGNAGSINVSANQLIIDGQGNSNNFTGISSQANSIGNAGYITVNAGSLNIFNGGNIDSTTFSQGNAGSVNVTANQLIIDGEGSNLDTGISSTAELNSTGNTGRVTVNAENLIVSNGGQISVANNGSNDAGNILINTHTLNAQNNSFISTFAKNGNGGNITINADSYLYLQDSSITTTTNGTTSNGGNININTPVLVMNTGLIQANAVRGSGGNINLNLQTLIPSYNSLIVGGEQIDWQPYIPGSNFIQIQGFNVIQAANAKGVNGAINNSSPQFDISGSLSGLTTKSLEAPTMARSPCNMGRSTLKRKGKGGLPRNETKEMLFIPPATLPTSPEISTEQPNSSEPTQKQENQPCAAI